MIFIASFNFSLFSFVLSLSLVNEKMMHWQLAEIKYVFYIYLFYTILFIILYYYIILFLVNDLKTATWFNSKCSRFHRFMCCKFNMHLAMQVYSI